LTVAEPYYIAYIIGSRAGHWPMRDGSPVDAKIIIVDAWMWVWLSENMVKSFEITCTF